MNEDDNSFMRNAPFPWRVIGFGIVMVMVRFEKQEIIIYIILFFFNFLVKCADLSENWTIIVYK